MNIAETQDWCAKVDATGLVAPAATGASQPVMAFVGAYNAGKTSLIRRLLHEMGLPTPAGLPVASDPTTFHALDVSAGDLILRDTPGLGSGKELHNARAMDAAVDADALVLVMTPQLLSAADSDAWELLTGAAWGRTRPPDSSRGLLLVVNRFDTAGPDPEHELDAYLALAERKKAELRASLAASAVVSDAATLVVASDPYGLRGDALNSETAYPDGAGWDGIPDVVQWLKAVGAIAPELRSERSVRTRGRALMLRARSLQEALPALEASDSATALRMHTVDTHRRDLHRMWRQAASERQESLYNVIGLDAAAAAAPDRAALLNDRLQRALQEWTDGLCDRLRVLSQAAPELEMIEEAPDTPRSSCQN